MPIDSFHIGAWLVEPSLQRISSGKEVRKLEPQLMAVLQILANRSGEVVTKEELWNTVWAEVIVTENVLTRAISSLRKALDDDRQNPRYIETISKTGYRLIAEVKRKSSDQNEETFTIKLARRPVIMVSTILVLVVLGAFATRSIFLPLSSDKIYHPISIANYSTTEYWPAISPDGRFVSYGWKGEADDNWDIYAKLIGTQTILRITDNPATDLRAVWSSDGNFLYYLRFEQGGATIYKKAVTGGEEVRIMSAPDFSNGNFDVSPDEKWISFNSRKSQEAPLQVVLTSLETGEKKWLTRPERSYNGDLHPTFSPDGKSIGFIREKNSVSMYLLTIDIESGKENQITTDHISINGFDWSDDGNSLFYGSDRSGLYKLWEVNVNSKATTLLPAGDYQMVMPRVSLTGNIIYAKMQDNVNIWSYDLENRTARNYRATNDLDLNGTISSKGDKVCFTSNQNGTFQIWVANRDGSEAKEITKFVGQYVNSPTWSSDDDEIIFQGFMDGQSDLFRVDSRGGVPENITQSDHDEHTPFIAANGDLYFSSNENGGWGIWRIEDGENNIEQLMDGNVYAPKVSRKGIVFYVKKEEMGLWSMDLQTKKETRVIENFHPMYFGAYTLSREGIFFFDARFRSFDFYDFQTSHVSTIYKPQKRIPRLGNTLHISPDGKNLLFSQIDLNDADIMMLEEQ